jgi:PAS domain S-box-containing protein
VSNTTTSSVGTPEGRAVKPPSAAARFIQLVVACSALLSCVIIAGTVTVIVDLRVRARADTERELRNMALVLAEQIDRSFEALALVESGLIERTDKLGILSADKLQNYMSTYEAHLMLKDTINGLPHIESVAVTDARGTIINFSRAWPIPHINVSDRTYFKTLTRDRSLTSVLSEPILNRTTGTWSIYLARKFVAENGEMFGIIVGGMEQRYFERYFGNINLGPSSAISLFRCDGVLLASYPARGELKRFEGDWLKSLLDRSDQGVVQVISAGGVERLVAARGLTHYPIIVSVGTSTAAALNGWRGQAVYLGVAAAFAVLMIGGITFVAIRHFRNYAILARERRESANAAVQHKATEFVLRETERVHQLLTKQKVQLDAALENMSQGLIMLDGNARMLICNQRYIDMYGLSPEIVKPGCTLKKLIEHQAEIGLIKDDVDQTVQRILASIAQGQPASNLRSLPDERMISVSSQPMPGGGWVATHQDVTEQHRAQRDAERAQKFLLTVIESVPSTIIVKDARSLRYLLINRAGERFYGFARAEVIGRTSHDLFPKNTAAMIVAYDKKLLESSGQLNLGEHTVETRNGPRVVTARQVAIRDESGRPMFLLNIVDEISDHRAVA